MKILYGLLALFWCALCSAATVNLTWQHPTQYVDGRLLPLSSITGYDVECKTFKPHGSTATQACPAGVKPVGVVAVYAFDVGVIPVTGGEYGFVIRTKTALASSADTNPAFAAFAAVQPNPPADFTVVSTIAGTLFSPVYGITPAGNMGVFLGLVSAGAACNGAEVYRYLGQPYRRIAAASVHWQAGRKPSVDVAAPCA